VTALAFVLTIGLGERFGKSKQVVSYLGLNPDEKSNGASNGSVRSSSKATRWCAARWSKPPRRHRDLIRD
jgi:hypothetical protein